MTTPPCMMVLNYYGYEYFCALPDTYEKAIAIITERLSVPSTHLVRLSLPAAEMHRYGLHQYLAGNSVYISDNDSYYYAIAGKPFVRFDVHAFEKNPSSGSGAKSAAAAPAAPATPATPAGGKPAASAKEPSKEAPKKEAPKEKPKAGPKTVEQNLNTRTLDKKEVKCTASVTGELAKGPPPGRYLGTLHVDKNHNQSFHGSQLGPAEHPTKFVVYSNNVARILFRPRAVRPKIDMLYPEERAVEVNLTLKGWSVSTVYPETPLRSSDGGGYSLRWFLRVKGKGIVEDVLHNTETSGVFYELVAEEAPQPKSIKPDSPLVPAWPDISPASGFCMPSERFVPHIDRVLSALGLPPDTRTNMITSWLPGVARHKNIAYRILNQKQLEPSSTLSIIPRPDLLLRIFIIFKGVPESELGDWAGRGIREADMGQDWIDALGWRDHVGYSDAALDEKLFRVVEYGSMEVFPS